MEKRTAYKETAERLKLEKEDFLSKALVRGKDCKKIREEMNCYADFKVWVLGTGYSISTINRDINRYELYILMEKEAGKETVENLSTVLLAWINKLQKYDEEKYMELVGLIDNGLERSDIKAYLEENMTEESVYFKGEELRGYFEDMEKEIKQIDIRSMKHSTGKKIMKTIKRVFRLISECTKLNTVKRNRELSRKIEEINNGIGVMSIS